MSYDPPHPSIQKHGQLIAALSISGPVGWPIKTEQIFITPHRGFSSPDEYVEFKNEWDQRKRVTSLLAVRMHYYFVVTKDMKNMNNAEYQEQKVQEILDRLQKEHERVLKEFQDKVKTLQQEDDTKEEEDESVEMEKKEVKTESVQVPTPVSEEMTSLQASLYGCPLVLKDESQKFVLWSIVSHVGDEPLEEPLVIVRGFFPDEKAYQTYSQTFQSKLDSSRFHPDLFEWPVHQPRIARYRRVELAEKMPVVFAQKDDLHILYNAPLLNKQEIEEKKDLLKHTNSP